MTWVGELQPQTSSNYKIRRDRSSNRIGRRTKPEPGTAQLRMPAINELREGSIFSEEIRFRQMAVFSVSYTLALFELLAWNRPTLVDGPAGRRAWTSATRG